MAKIVKQQNRKDNSTLRKELSYGVPARSVSYGHGENYRQTDYLSRAKRRRDDLMDNRRMRYAYSTRTLVLHDRDCPNVENIPDEEFQMLTEFSDKMHRCDRCYRRALIRAGVWKDFNIMDEYEFIFKKLGALHSELYTLMIQHRAKLYGVGADFVRIKVREDHWMIRIQKDGMALYHNNYSVMDGFERVLADEFHLQNDNGDASFRNYVRIMTQYTWRSHITAFKEQELELRRELCRENRMKAKRILEKIDYNFYLCTFPTLSAKRKRLTFQELRSLTDRY